MSVRAESRVLLRPWLWRRGGAALAGVLVAVIALPLSIILPFDSTARARTAVHAAPKLTASDLAAMLAATARRRKVPDHLDPPLTSAIAAKPIIALNGCHLLHGGIRSKPCSYGDRTSHTTVVVFGDSHASVWFPGLELIAEQRHWRLLDLTKDGCPPAEVNVAAWFRRGAPYWECTVWRDNAQAEIATMHPALVVVTTASYVEAPEARPIPGIPGGYGGTWEDGWAATFSFLRQSARHVIFISDTPKLRINVPDCVLKHMSDVRRCSTPRSAAVAVPRIKALEIAVAEREHIDWIDPTSWFCAPNRCPGIVGNIVLYRDNAHMTPAWSRFIAPVLATDILPIMGSKTTRS